AVAAQQRADLGGMGDEWRVVDFPVLVGVAGSGESQRGQCRRQIGEPACVTQGGGGAWTRVVVDVLDHSAITPSSRRLLRFAVRAGVRRTEPGRHDFSRVYLLCELRLLLLAPGGAYPRAGGAGDGIAA